jgi:hypothetical protein
MEPRRLLTLSDLKINKNYFPVRRYSRHIILVALLDIPRQIQFRFFNPGPNTKVEITRSEWEEAKARALGVCNIKLESFEQIFWKDEPPSYDTLVDNLQQV